MIENITLLSVAGNHSVVKLQSRAFPSLTIQGDTLNIWYKDLQRIKSLLSLGDLKQAEEEIELLMEPLQDLTRIYASECVKHGFDVPV